MFLLVWILGKSSEKTTFYKFPLLLVKCNLKRIQRASCSCGILALQLIGTLQWATCFLASSNQSFTPFEGGRNLSRGIIIGTEKSFRTGLHDCMPNPIFYARITWRRCSTSSMGTRFTGSKEIRSHWGELSVSLPASREWLDLHMLHLAKILQWSPCRFSSRRISIPASVWDPEVDRLPVVSAQSLNIWVESPSSSCNVR